MARRGGAMHVSTTRRHYIGRDGRERTYETHLLRRSFRDGAKVRNETLANLPHLPAEAITAIRAVLSGEHVVVAGQGFVLERALPHGHVAAVWTAARALGFPGLLGEPGRMRDIALALIIARVVRPGSKLATRRWWADTTLAADLNVTDATRDEVYAALDWLACQQQAIEAQLAARHLTDGGRALFDLSSSWVTGRHCPLAAFGYSRDARRDHPQAAHRRFGPAGSGAGVPRQHRRPSRVHHHPHPAAGGLRPLRGGGGRRPRHAHPRPHRRAPGPERVRLDHRAACSRRRARRRRVAAAESVRPGQPRRDQPPRLSRRAA